MPIFFRRLKEHALPFIILVSRLVRTLAKTRGRVIPLKTIYQELYGPGIQTIHQRDWFKQWSSEHQDYEVRKASYNLLRFVRDGRSWSFTDNCGSLQAKYILTHNQRHAGDCASASFFGAQQCSTGIGSSSNLLRYICQRGGHHLLEYRHDWRCSACQRLVLRLSIRLSRKQGINSPRSTKKPTAYATRTNQRRNAKDAEEIQTWGIPNG